MNRIGNDGAVSRVADALLCRRQTYGTPAHHAQQPARSAARPPGASATRPAFSKKGGLLLATMLLISGCATYAIRSDTTPQWGAPQQNLQLGLAMARATTDDPSEITLTLQFRNSGSNPCHLNTSGKVSWTAASEPPTASRSRAFYQGSLDYPRHGDGAEALDAVLLPPGESVERLLQIKIPALTTGQRYRIQVSYENACKAGIASDAHYVTCIDKTFKTDRHDDMWQGRLSSGVLLFTVEP